MDNSPKANLAEAQDVVCDKCGDRRFEPVHLMKKLSAIMSPDGQEHFVPVGVMTGFTTIWGCYKCGHINEAFLPPPMRAGAAERIKLDKERESGIVSSVLPDTPVPPKLKLEE